MPPVRRLPIVLVVAFGWALAAVATADESGTVVPTKPTKVRAERTSKHGARIRFRRSQSRGSEITSYEAKCSAEHASASGNATKPPIRLGDLEQGVAYRCRVRARSKAGPGPWSKRVTVPAKPS